MEALTHTVQVKGTCMVEDKGRMGVAVENAMGKDSGKVVGKGEEWEEVRMSGHRR